MDSWIPGAEGFPACGALWRPVAACGTGVVALEQRTLDLEACILDFEGDLYGQQVRLEFVGRLRDEEKYDSVEALLEQIDRDVEQTKAILGAAQ